MIRVCIGTVFLIAMVASSYAQVTNLPAVVATNAGATPDVNFQILWLVESDDENRMAYAGPARKGLSAAGYGRLVQAGSGAAPVSVGLPATIVGSSRFGQFSVMVTTLNTTLANQVQVKVSAKTRSESPLEIDTTARAPFGRWFLLGSSDSHVAVPKHQATGTRGIVIMRVDQGIVLLD